MGDRLRDKVAVITGAASGIGAAAARLFAAEGAKIVGCDVNSDTAQSTLEAVKAKGGNMVSLHPCDMTIRSNVDRFEVSFAFEVFEFLRSVTVDQRLAIEFLQAESSGHLMDIAKNNRSRGCFDLDQHSRQSSAKLLDLAIGDQFYRISGTNPVMSMAKRVPVMKKRIQPRVTAKRFL